MPLYRFGLDVGTNSLGWSVLALDREKQPCRIEAAGARIFSDGRDVKSQATLKADRRAARSARRRRDRFQQRQRFLVAELQKAGLLPDNAEEMKALQGLNPLKLRATALTEKLQPCHIGRALFHLNQRRGFKSNRKDRSEEATGTAISDSVRLLLEEMDLIGARLPANEYNALSRQEKKKAREQEAEARTQALRNLAVDKTLTYGSFLWKRQQAKKSTRARRGAGENGKLYEVYPQREMYEDEFDKIWKAQACHYPDLMTDTVRTRIRNAIFFQRPLKPQELGNCAYMPDEKRTFRAMPSFQRYRMYQEVNNLEWTTSRKKYRLIDYPDARDEIMDLLEKVTTKDGLVRWSKMKNILKKRDIIEGDFVFNFEGPKRNGFHGNLTSRLMQDEDCVGKEKWHGWSVEKQDEFISVILGDELDDEKVCEDLQREYGLSDYAAKNCMTALLEDGAASLSLGAARLLTQKMKENYLIQSDAVQAVAEENENFSNPYTRARDGKLRESLPYYGQAFQDGRHIIPGARNPEDAHDDLKFYGGVTNPTVHIALNQIRQVVNELICRYGHPDSISVELGRDLPAGAERRKEIEKEQSENQKQNERLDEKLRELGQSRNRDNRLRLRLWEEQDKDDPHGCFCPFSGKKISVADLFSSAIEVDHLIPFKFSLDDKISNKVLCTRQANREKGERTPFEAFGNRSDVYNWDEIFERSKQLPEPKRWRFQEDAREIWLQDHDDFLARHLNDTRYIGRLTREYLENICPFQKIDVVTGYLTALLRSHWGLDRILRDHAGTEGAPKKKNRDDHRHHAVDAIVVGMTTRSMLQKVSTAAGRAESLELDRLFERGIDGKSPIDPWDNFRAEAIETVRGIVVSHKPRRKKLHYDTENGKRIKTTDGQLHNDTAYGIVSGPDEKGRYKVVVRWPVEKFTKREQVNAIRSPYLREEFLNAFDAAEESGEKGSVGVVEYAKKNKIRKLRRTEMSSVIPISDRDGRIYKAYQGDSNWGMEIYEYPENHKKSNQWEGVVISRYEANQPNFKMGESHRPHPCARLIMRLRINDFFEIEQEGKRKIMRVQKISQNELAFVLHCEANVDARHRDKKNPFQYFRKTPNALKALSPRKVHISPTGLVSYENRRRPRRKK